VKLGISKTIEKKQGKKEIDPRTKYIKYIILITIPITSYYTASLFYTTFCPVGGFTGTLPTMTFYGSEWVAGTTFPLKITSVVLFILLILLVTRGWCKYLCPVAAMLAPMNKLSATGITRDDEKCIDCGLCERNCPMEIKDIGAKPELECILCGRCVPTCRKESLKLGSRVTYAKIVAIVPIITIIIIASTMLIAGVWAGGYERTDAINDIPCLGCLALDPQNPEGWFFVENRTGEDLLPDFIMEQLVEGPVIIDYRTTVCAACDEMDPHVEDLKEDYTDEVFFFKHNKDPTLSNFENLDDYDPASVEYQSYFIFDVKGDGEKITGVPLFPIITYGADENGTVGIMFKVLYGSSADGGVTQKSNIASALDEAIILYDIYGRGNVYYSGEQTPFVELFVAMDCSNCPKSEEALVELMDEEVTTFVSYVADAPGISGAIALDREAYFTTSLNVTAGRPWAVYAGGPNEEQGAASISAVKQIYTDELANDTYLEPLNVSLAGEIFDSGTDIVVNVTATNIENTTESLRIQVFLLEVKSRWLNDYTHEPIPYAMVDVLLNDTYDISGGDSEAVSITWDGTDVLSYSDFRMSNVAVMAVVWQDDVQVNSKLIESGISEALWMTSLEPVKVSLPNNTATFTLQLINYQDTPMTVNLSATGVPANLTVNFSQTSLTIPAYSNQTFDITTTGTGTVDGDVLSFIVEAEDVTDPTLSTSKGLLVEVKDDITPPVILEPTHTSSSILDGELTKADEQISISVTVGDNVDLESVVMEYYSCDDFVCSPTLRIEMEPQGNVYVPVEIITAMELHHNILHYWIIAEDTSANINRTIEYDITIEPVQEPADAEEGTTSVFNTYGIGFILIFAMVAIGLNLTRMRRVSIKAIKPDDSLEETVVEEVGSRQWALAMIKYIESQIESGKQIGAEFSEVEKLLTGAKMMVGSGNHEDAYELLNQCSEDAGQRIHDYERLSSIIKKAEIEIKAAEDNGKDVTEAKSLLNLAKQNQAGGDYTIAVNNAKKSIESLTTKK
jgi:ferredoxin